MPHNPTLFSLAFFALTGCAGGYLSSTTITKDQLAINPDDTASSRPDIFLTAKLAGKLTADEKCVFIKTAKSEVTPLWPEGTAIIRRDNAVEIQLPDNRGTATMGRSITLSGGDFPTESQKRLSARIRQNCPGAYFTVSTLNK